MNGTMEMHSYLPRSFSKDALNHSHERMNSNQMGSNENLHRPQSAGQQTRSKTMINHQQQQQQPENDFQSKREFFENRTYIDHSSSNTSLSSLQSNILPSKPKLYTLSPSNPQQTTINNNPPRNITR